jgi:hypothetical protein
MRWSVWEFEGSVCENVKVGNPAMKLVDEIIELSSSESGSVATLLRKCLVLAHTIKNDRLKTWAE